MHKLTTRRSASAANRCLELLPPRLKPVVVVRTTHTSVSTRPMSTIAGPILFKPRGSSRLIVLVQPLDKSALKDVAEGARVASRGPHQKFVPSPVGLQIGKVPVMRLLLPCNACGTVRTSEMALIMQKVMQARHL